MTHQKRNETALLVRTAQGATHEFTRVYLLSVSITRPLNSQREVFEFGVEVSDGYIYQSSFYFISTEKRNWTESRRYCTERGADLIIINNREEHEFVKKISDGTTVWIGLTDSDVEDRWKWVDGTNMTSGCKDTSQDDHRDDAAASQPSHSDRESETEIEGPSQTLPPLEVPCCRHSSPARGSAAPPAEMEGIPAPPPPVAAEERTQKEAANPATYSSDPAVSKVDMQRHRKRKKQVDESTEPDYERSGRDKFKTTVFIAIIDRLIAELDRRYHSYRDIQQTFGFLSEIPSTPLQDLRTGAANLQKKYAGDLEEDFVDEIGQFRQFIK
ncbi:C-type lectin domain family 4 member F [Anabarilius grahami]|uniref:C-type lectin domain family 4 member F n=1 Tax=Anabarilius grahami TaxID=495550 RepID=A0A3N0Z4M5_ANAGA|nr:C-type lectin domain family 4 member F [Anabarilius grahami]